MPRVRGAATVEPRELCCPACLDASRRGVPHPVVTCRIDSGHDHAQGGYIAVAVPAGLLTKLDVARVLKASPRTVERLAATGALPVIHPSPGLTRFDPADLETYIASCKSGGEAA